MPLLLTGDSGFVGRHVQDMLECVSLNPPGGPFVDIRDFDLLKSAIARVRPKQVIHLAALSEVPYAARHPRETIDINFLGTFNLLQSLLETGFEGRMLYVGSAAVYGLVPPEALPITENYPLRPNNYYSASKVAAEAWCHATSRSAPFEIVLARPFNHVGPGQRREFALADFAAQMVEMRLGRREPLLTTGNLNVTRDFTDVRDVVRAYLMLLKHGENGDVYNVCSGYERGLQDVIQGLGRAARASFRTESRPERQRSNDQLRLVGSPAKLNALTGWQPEIPWEQTLTDIVAYWEEKLHE